MLFGVMSIFNEAATIRQCVESFPDCVDRIIVVDGAFADFPHKHFHSTDGTLEILQDMDKVDIIYAPGRPWRDQVEKRNRYLIGKDGDYYLQLDGDELWWGSLPWKLDAMAYKIKIVRTDRVLAPYWGVRLWRHRGKMEYRGCHCALFSDGKLINRLADAQPLEAGKIIHLIGVRSFEREAAWAAFQRRQNEREAEFRRQWRI